MSGNPPTATNLRLHFLDDVLLPNQLEDCERSPRTSRSLKECTGTSSPCWLLQSDVSRNKCSAGNLYSAVLEAPARHHSPLFETSWAKFLRRPVVSYSIGY